jgi:Dyp-type peroxidase family
MSLFELEPELEDTEIQGNVFPGFNKPCQNILPIFFEEENISQVKQWLLDLESQVTAIKDVLVFREERRALRQRNQNPDLLIGSVWLNIAFSFQGLRKLTPSAEDFRDNIFRRGLDKAAASRLGDPLDPTQPDAPKPAGSPSTWIFGVGDKTPDALVIIAGDDPALVQEQTLAVLSQAEKSRIRCGHYDTGLDLRLFGLPRGIEHFGFKDGVSQPGIRGVLKSNPSTFLTPRSLPKPADPNAIEFAQFGQPLICPGEFVLGYPRQSDASGQLASAPYTLLPEPNAIAPTWAKNGSFLVYRRLRQDVPGFYEFISSQVEKLQADGLTNINSDLLSALIVGRWKNGAPIAKYPESQPMISDCDLDALQNFGYQIDAGAIKCPASAHIRKVNPRDLTTEQGSSGQVGTLVHRILRRGIPYGLPYDSSGDPETVNIDRGLLFISYQASIREQFEFLLRNWANDTRKPQTPDGDWGQDMVIGQGINSQERNRFFLIQKEQRYRISTDSGSIQDWVAATGGGYFFSPSKSALRDVLAR